jgi:hypothetical protein
VLDILVEIAERSLYHDEDELAAQILALALQYPMRVETLERAEVMFSSIEARVCPRVLWDAFDLARRMTLEDMVAHVIKESAE